MTTIAASNTFLDPMNLLATDSAVTPEASLITLQAFRLAISALAIVVTPLLIVALVPNKNGARWKMPLRGMAAIVSLGMLTLNAFSWGISRVDEPGAALLSSNEVLSYVVLALSMALLITMAICFVVFVVFRGAQEQRREEEAEVDEGIDEELIRLARAVLDATKRAHVFAAWKALKLPPGWVKMMQDADAAARTPERPYWQHTATGTSLWHVPTASDVATADAKAGVLAAAAAAVEAVARAAAAAAAMESSSGSSSSSSSSSSSDSSSDDDGAASAARKPKKVKKFVRWVFKKRDGISLAQGLLGAEGAAAGADGAEAAPPPYLRKLFAMLFVAGDRNNDGKLSTIEIMHMMQTRAKGTVLDGNSQAIFKLQRALEEQAAHDEGSEIGTKEFESGLYKVLLAEPNGAVAQWILKEAQDDAARWTRRVGEGEEGVSYTHPRDGVTTEAPEIILQMQRCAKVLR